MKSAILALVASTGVAAAATFDTVQMQMFEGVPNFSGSFTFNQFNAADFGNPADITLDAVMVTLTVQIADGVFQLDNDGVDGATVNAQLGAQVTLTGNGVIINALVATPTTSDTFNLAGNNGDDDQNFTFEPGDPDFAQLNGTGQIASDMDTYVGLFAAQFAGAGTFGLDYSALQIFNQDGQGGISFAGTPVTAKVIAEVKYTYTVVPAPAAFGVLSLAGLVAGRRRR